MKGIKLAGKHDPDAKHDDEGNEKTGKVEPPALGGPDSGVHLVGGRRTLTV